MMKLRAICFDLDNTFWDVGPVIRRAEQELNDWLVEHCPGAVVPGELDAVRRERQGVIDDHPTRGHDLTFIRREALRRRIVAAGHREELAHHAFDVFIAARNRVQPFDDVVPALRRLGREFRLFTLTNGNADLARIGLAGHFEHCLSAEAVGCAKPDPRIFAALLERAGLPPEAVLHVGDEPHTDVVGAHGAGLHAAWVNRRGEAWPDDLPAPRYVVPDLGALAARLLATVTR